VTACVPLPVAPPADSAREDFAADSPHQRKVAVDAARGCEGARRALLGDGYLIERADGEEVRGRKAYPSDGDRSTFVEMRVACVPDAEGATLYANGLLSTYEVKKSTGAASVGLTAFGSVSVPIGQSAESMVKTGEATVGDREFYRRFFAAVEGALVEMERRPRRATAPPAAAGPSPRSPAAGSSPVSAPAPLPAEARPESAATPAPAVPRPIGRPPTVAASPLPTSPGPTPSRPGSEEAGAAVPTPAAPAPAIVSPPPPGQDGPGAAPPAEGPVEAALPVPLPPSPGEAGPGASPAPAEAGPLAPDDAPPPAEPSAPPSPGIPPSPAGAGGVAPLDRAGSAADLARPPDVPASPGPAGEVPPGAAEAAGVAGLATAPVPGMTPALVGPGTPEPGPLPGTSLAPPAAEAPLAPALTPQSAEAVPGSGGVPSPAAGSGPRSDP
jgi:hypothetical protein